jgi:hypothetical protein
VAWVIAVQLTTTVRALAGVEQVAVGAGAAGRAWDLASPLLDAARATVQVVAAHAREDVDRRLSVVRNPTATRRALRHMRRPSSPLSVVPL